MTINKVYFYIYKQSAVNFSNKSVLLLGFVYFKINWVPVLSQKSLINIGKLVFITKL